MYLDASVRPCVCERVCLCLHRFIGATDSTTSCPVADCPDYDCLPDLWCCANQSQIQRQWLPVSWNIPVYLNNFTWFQWLLLCHQASWRVMIPVNPPAPGYLNGIKWVIGLLFFVFSCCRSAPRRVESKYILKTVKPVPDARFIKSDDITFHTIQLEFSTNRRKCSFCAK